MTIEEIYAAADFSEVEDSDDSITPSNLIDPSEETILAVIQANLDGSSYEEIKTSILQDGKSLSFSQISQIIEAAEATEVELYE